MNKSPTKVVCDAGPLINLDELDCIDLLSDFQTVLEPEQLWQEFETLVRALALDLGEQAALSHLESNPEAILLTDDSTARLAVEGLGYKAHGSLGVLLRAIHHQHRTQQEVVQILHSLPTRSSLHIRPDLLQRIIPQVETEAS